MHGWTATGCLESPEASLRAWFLSQEKLAVDAQIDRTNVSSLERGLENPIVSVLDKLAAALSITVADFSEYSLEGSDLRSRYREDVVPSRTRECGRFGASHSNCAETVQSCCQAHGKSATGIDFNYHGMPMR